MSLRLYFSVLSIAAVLTFTAQAGFAQKVANTGPKYDVTKEMTFKGVVEDIREVPGEFEGVHLVVKTDNGTVLVHVAPAAFLKEIETSFNKGDQVQVLGAKAPNTTEEEILAREITVGNNTTTLRDGKGVPVWAGWNPGRSGGK